MAVELNERAESELLLELEARVSGYWLTRSPSSARIQKGKVLDERTENDVSLER